MSFYVYPFSIAFAGGQMCGVQTVFGRNKDDARQRFLSKKPKLRREHIITVQRMKHLPSKQVFK